MQPCYHLPHLTLCLLILGSSILPAAAGTPLLTTRLRTEYLTDPLGIDVSQPRLSWILSLNKPGTTPETRGKAQFAYRILVASSLKELAIDRGDLWDSGKVVSRSSVHVPYSGIPLKSRERCFWKVKVWDERGAESGWSKTAYWEMGLLRPGDWHGSWIGVSMPTPVGKLDAHPAPYLRREFAVRKGILRARIYASGVGTAELHLNGHKVGATRERDPGYTDFNKRVLYVVHDVTSMIRPGGENALGAILGTGWFDVHDVAVWRFEKASWRGRPRVRAMLVIDYKDGSSETIATDSSWQATTEGPIRADGIYSGEVYDASRELTGWDRIGYKGSGWKAADELPAPKGQLAALRCPPIVLTRTITPKAISEPRPGVFVVDMGENFTGHAQLSVQQPAGTRIRMRYSEQVGKDGMIDRAAITTFLPPPGIFQEDTYICKGRGVETWEQRFSYSGFRYVEVTGFHGKFTVDQIKGRFVHTDFDSAGEFACSNEGLNQVQAATLQSYLCNAQSIPTDCPTREKNGWTGDAHLAADAGLLNFDSAAFYTKWLDDIKDNQLPDGRVGVIIPTAGWGLGDCQPAWDSVYPLITWDLYKYQGDVRILEEHYDRIKRYVDFLHTKTDGGVVTLTDKLGDWCPWLTETPNDLTSTAFYYEDSRIISEAAKVLGRADDVKKYAGWAAEARDGFNRKFANTDLTYGNGSQTSMAAALYFNLVPEDKHQAVLDRLVRDVKKLGHIDTGILGAKWLLATLSSNGRADVAYLLASRTREPGWIAMDMSSKTLWESWPGEQSRNHIMFGSVSGWFYQTLAGINLDPAQPGYKHFTISPQMVDGLTWVKSMHMTMHGQVVSNWAKENGFLSLDVSVPVNTQATILIPAGSEASVLESGKAAGGRPGVKFVKLQDGVATYEVGSGDYHFVSPTAKL